MKAPVLSIVVPVYNVQNYVSECVISLIIQQDSLSSYYEIICIDDGATDDSGSIIDEFAVKNSNALIVHKGNGGVSSARNSGITLSAGKYLWFVDSDDIVSQQCVQKIIVHILNNRNLDLIRISACSFEDGENIPKVTTPPIYITVTGCLHGLLRPTSSK